MISPQRTLKRCLGAGIVSLLFVLSPASPGRALSSEPFAASDSMASQHAAYFGVDMATARREVALTDEAARLQNALADKFPNEFAGLWIEHEPAFAVAVALTTRRDAAIRAEAGAFLTPFLVTRVHQHSLIELQRAVADLRLQNLEYSTSIDEENNQAVIEILASDRAEASVALSQELDSGLMRLDGVSSLPLPVADIYGGLNLDACGGGLSGTAGWSVKRTSSGVTGIMTAGHLDDCLKYNGVNTTFVAGSTNDNADAQWHTTTFVERPWFKGTSSGAIQIVSGVRSYSNIAIGQVVCKWGRTTHYGCGTVEAKGVDPDGGGPLNAVFVRVQNCSGPSIAEPGDSGGPVFSGSLAVGHITHKTGDIFCSYKMIFNSVTHSTAQLGLAILLP